jgi:hypothetical protein
LSAFNLPRPKTVAHLTAAVDRGADVEVESFDLDAEVGGLALYLSCQVRAFQQRLGRDTSPVQTDTAKPTFSGLRLYAGDIHA